MITIVVETEEDQRAVGEALTAGLGFGGRGFVIRREPGGPGGGMTIIAGGPGGPGGTGGGGGTR